MENYICINGKKAELTEEQMKALGIEMPKVTMFTRTKNKRYYSISGTGKICGADGNRDIGCETDDRLYEVANYCTNRAIMEQRALYEILHRQLWRYSMEHDGDKIHLNHCWGIAYSNGVYEAYELYGHVVGESIFYSEEIAKAALKEIIEPFMKAHPEFKW